MADEKYVYILEFGGILVNAFEDPKIAASAWLNGALLGIDPNRDSEAIAFERSQAGRWLEGGAVGSLHNSNGHYHVFRLIVR